MCIKESVRATIAGGCAGVINGLFGAGGGLILVPLLSKGSGFSKTEVFSSSVLIILPMCLITLCISSGGIFPWKIVWPYLIGGGLGGMIAAFTGKFIPLKWLHRFLGVMILYAGVKYLC